MYRIKLYFGLTLMLAGILGIYLLTFVFAKGSYVGIGHYLACIILEAIAFPIFGILLLTTTVMLALGLYLVVMAVEDRRGR